MLHCSAFRRLDYKTQVFVPHERDHFRTRLTHTLEVAQIGRNLARALRLNEDLVEAAALAHDLGHPPFGHAGEEALDRLMAEHGHFEHNRQSLRVVDYLEHPYLGFRGLNLTRAVRMSLAKHETRHAPPAGDEFDDGLSGSAEAQLTDTCDAIAYSAADLSDALEARWLARDELGGLTLWQAAWARAEAEAADARPIHKEIRATRSIVSLLAEDLLAESARRLEAGRYDSPRAVQGAAEKVIGFTEPVAQGLEQLKRFLYERVYVHPVSLAKDAEGQQLIAELFAHFLARPEDLPARFARRLDADGLHRTICDYIAGMTDRYCRDEHDRLVGP